MLSIYVGITSLVCKSEKVTQISFSALQKGKSCLYCLWLTTCLFCHWSILFWKAKAVSRAVWNTWCAQLLQKHLTIFHLNRVTHKTALPLFPIENKNKKIWYFFSGMCRSIFLWKHFAYFHLVFLHSAIWDILDSSSCEWFQRFYGLYFNWEGSQISECLNPEFLFLNKYQTNPKSRELHSIDKLKFYLLIPNYFWDTPFHWGHILAVSFFILRSLSPSSQH